MKRSLQITVTAGFTLVTVILSACNNNTASESTVADDSLELKRGELIACGPPDKEFGAVTFPTSCSEKTKKDFELGIALLHSFEYDEAEKLFARVLELDPKCAIAYWGVAMSNYHTLWMPPTVPELEKGSKAADLAIRLAPESGLEKQFIDAMALFYKDWKTTDHRTRSMNYLAAMEKLYNRNASNKEVAVFYSLALIGTAEPTDKTYANQKKAGQILSALYPEGPNHPGIVHYIIHAYDAPELATMGLDAARRYASVAPSSAHAQHMPSHIFTRMGLWEENIKSNLAASESAKCYAETAGIKGHWDEEMHCIDYLIYGYLQRGETDLARQQYDYLKTIKEVSPMNFKVAYAFAAVPGRYMLENRLWNEATQLTPEPATVPWNKFPWQKSMIHFTRLMGFINTDKIAEAETELTQMKALHDSLLKRTETYQANQLMIQAKTGEAWILLAKGNKSAAITMLTDAADMEDKTDKHAVTPGAIIPAREWLAELYLRINQPLAAQQQFDLVLKKQPNRFNALYGAAKSAEINKDMKQATLYYSQLTKIAGSPQAKRAELDHAKLFLGNATSAH